MMKVIQITGAFVFLLFIIAYYSMQSFDSHVESNQRAFDVGVTDRIRSYYAADPDAGLVVLNGVFAGCVETRSGKTLPSFVVTMLFDIFMLRIEDAGMTEDAYVEQGTAIVAQKGHEFDDGLIDLSGEEEKEVDRLMSEPWALLTAASACVLDRLDQRREAE